MTRFFASVETGAAAFLTVGKVDALRAFFLGDGLSISLEAGAGSCSSPVSAVPEPPALLRVRRVRFGLARGGVAAAGAGAGEVRSAWDGGRDESGEDGGTAACVCESGCGEAG